MALSALCLRTVQPYSRRLENGPCWIDVAFFFPAFIGKFVMCHQLQWRFTCWWFQLKAVKISRQSSHPFGSPRHSGPRGPLGQPQTAASSLAMRVLGTGGPTPGSDNSHSSWAEEGAAFTILFRTSDRNTIQGVILTSTGPYHEPYSARDPYLDLKNLRRAPLKYVLQRPGRSHWPAPCMVVV